MAKIRVLIVDDHTVVRAGIRIILATEPSILVVGEASSGSEALRKIKKSPPDVVLMDLVMPGKDGIETTAEIKRDYPDVKIIVLTTFEDDAKIDAAMAVGANGYLLKDADGEFLLQAIKAAQQGDLPLHPRVARSLFKNQTVQKPDDQNYLTKREKEVLQLVAKGWSNREIANELCLTEGTIKVHVSNILSKLHVSRRTEAAVWAVRAGLLDAFDDTREV